MTIRKNYITIFLAIAFLAACSNEKKVDKKVFNNAPFKIVDPDSSGIQFSNDLTPNGDLNIIEYLYYYNGGGVALGDINNDGLDDIYFTANQKPDKLYLNLGNLRFRDISEECGISTDTSWSTGVTMSDVNNDGLLDIYVCKVGDYKGLKAKNELYINTGNNKFVESAEEYGLAFSGFSTQASFFDYDNDGDVDMYLMNHSVHSPHSYGNTSLRQMQDSLAGDVLFENKDNHFVDVTNEAGIYNSSLGYGLALATGDINDDGLIDIYVGNDFHENDYLYINNGDKTFTESSKDFFNHTSRFTMGVDIGDLNNDHREDIVTLDMMPYESDIFLKSGGEDSDKVNEIKKSFGFLQQYARNNLQLNNGNYFSEIALISDVYATDWSWSPLLLDYDNDGYNDLYITNGIYKRPNDLDYIKYLSNVDFTEYTISKQDSIEEKLVNAMPTLNLPNILYRNDGNLNFNKIEPTAEIHKTYSNGAAYSDLDNDGDLDIVVNNINQTATVLENTSKSNNYLKINLLGENKSINTNSSKVYVYSNGSEFFRQSATVRGFQSSSTRQLHFGLGNSKTVDSVVVIWKDQTKTLVNNPEINSRITIEKSNRTDLTKKIVAPTEQTPFDYIHIENTYLDYEKEGLIPENLSIEGPSLVQADFNNDGLLDLFIGGAKGKAPSLYFQTNDGEFALQENQDLNNDSIYEDVDAVAIDIDGDSDLDIYALSGGNEYKEGNPLLEDRVYMNDGKGNFNRLNSNLLATNGGSVSAFDYDNDGNTDIFIGNRSLPGAYGLSPFSIILKNKGDNTFEIAFKQRIGMVTDSCWGDLDGDGNTELVIVGDWMPITILSYDGNKTFKDRTAEFGLSDSNGMWNVVKIKDINKDGQLDLLAGNTGLNFKWKASKSNPVKMYLSDFDKNGKLDQLIFYNFFGTYVPFASKDKLMEQLPSLKKKFVDYKSFSEVHDFGDLFNKDSINLLDTKFIKELRSMFYINNGKKYIPKPLPTEAQYSTIEDFLLEDDTLLFTGNYYGFVAELGESSSNAGGIINISNDTLSYGGMLPLPKNFQGRKIVKIRKNTFLVIANNDKSQLIKLKQKNR